MASRRKVTTNDGHEIGYIDAGSGPALILVPARLSSASSWESAGYIDRFITSHRVIAVDPLGHGQSDAPADPMAYRAEAVVGHIVDVLEHGGITDACLWGYAEGAEISALVARRRPDLVRGLIYGGAYLGDVVEELRRVGFDSTGFYEQCAVALENDDWDAYFDMVEMEFSPEARAALKAANTNEAAAALTRAAALRVRRFMKPAGPTLAYWSAGERFAAANRDLAEAMAMRWVTVPGSHSEGFDHMENIAPAVDAFTKSIVRG